MNVPFKMKRLALADMPALKEIGQKTFIDAFAPLNSEENMRLYLEEAYSDEKLSAELSDPNSEFYFLLKDDQPIAYLKLNANGAQTESHVQNSLEVERIYVLKAFQGQQIGQYLLDFSIEEARRRKMNTLWLGVWEHNYGAVRFYERNGFERFGSHVFQLGNDPQTDILMRMNFSR